MEKPESKNPETIQGIEDILKISQTVKLEQLELVSIIQQFTQTQLPLEQHPGIKYDQCGNPYIPQPKLEYDQCGDPIEPFYFDVSF